MSGKKPALSFMFMADRPLCLRPCSSNRTSWASTPKPKDLPNLESRLWPLNSSSICSGLLRSRPVRKLTNRQVLTNTLGSGPEAVLAPVFNKENIEETASTVQAKTHVGRPALSVAGLLAESCQGSWLAETGQAD